MIEQSTRRASSTKSIAVIGAGPGGLAAALQLAAAGFQVTVYEAQPVVGGRSRRLTAGPYSFDCGPTFFLMPYVLEEIFAACGFRLSDFVSLRRLDPMYRLIIGSRESAPTVLDTTQDIAQMTERLARIDPRDGAAFLHFMEENRKKLARLTPVLKKRVQSLLDLMSPQGVAAAPYVRPWESVHQCLSKTFHDRRTRLALCFQAKYLGMSPYECPSLFSILPFIEYEYGIWHPEGGCNRIMSAMADACTRMGVRMETSSPVDAIAFDGRSVAGVHIGGTLRRHDRVVVNADGTWAMKNLIPAELRGRDSDAAIDARRYSCSTFMMYLGVRGAIDLPHHTIYMSGRYEETFRDISQLGRLTEDPSTYVHNPSALDPTLAPAGKSALYVLLPVTNNDPRQCSIDWERERPRLREDALRQLEGPFGIRDIRRRIEREVLMTPLDWQRERINHGATFNLAHNFGQMLHKRIPHTHPKLAGLHFVGGATHPGSGLPVIFLSSTIASRHICQLDGRVHPFDAPVPETRASVAPAAVATIDSSGRGVPPLAAAR
jgi:phytoene desaturase